MRAQWWGGRRHSRLAPWLLKAPGAAFSHVTYIYRELTSFHLRVRRHESVRAARVDPRRQVQRPLRHRLVSGHPAVRHGVRRRAVRVGRGDLAGTRGVPHAVGARKRQDETDGRVPGFNSAVSTDAAVRPSGTGRFTAAPVVLVLPAATGARIAGRLARTPRTAAGGQVRRVARVGRRPRPAKHLTPDVLDLADN